MKFYQRKTTFFEKILLLSGFFVGFLGFYMINFVYRSSGMAFGYDLITVIFLWIIMLFLIIIAATSENQKEESTIISYELHAETKLMKDNLLQMTEEIKRLRQDLTEGKKKK